MKSLTLRVWRRFSESTLLVAFSVFAVVMTLGVAGFYFLELRPGNKGDLFDALWWGVVTVTTVGYGDIVPSTPAGKFLSMALMATGIGLLATLSGNLASALVERRAKKRKGLLKVNISGHFIILGWNVHALSLIKALTKGHGLEKSTVVCVNALDPGQFQEQTSHLDLGQRLLFVHGAPSQEGVLGRAAPSRAKQAYIISPEEAAPEEADQQSLFAALTFRGLAPKTPLFAEVIKASNRAHLLRAGVNEAVCRGELSSRILGTMGSHPILWDLIHNLVGQADGAGLGYRRMSAEERAMTWKALVARTLEQENILPLAVYRLSRDVTLEDLMDQNSALDNYILQLFNAYGHETTLGEGGRAVRVNPADAADLTDFDGILFVNLNGGAR